MAKRNLLKAAGLALAATGALGFGLGTSPAGQEVLTAAQQQTQVMKAQQGKKATAKQQMQQQQQKVVTSSKAVYLPWRPNDRVWGKSTMSPKQYGIYPLMTGKNKYNDRRNKHWAKAVV